MIKLYRYAFVVRLNFDTQESNEHSILKEIEHQKEKNLIINEIFRNFIQTNVIVEKEKKKNTYMCFLSVFFCEITHSMYFEIVLLEYVVIHVVKIY